jgi:hypothetical protein
MQRASSVVFARFIPYIRLLGIGCQKSYPFVLHSVSVNLHEEIPRNATTSA